MIANGAPTLPDGASIPAAGPTLYSSFHRPQWRITPERAEAWVRHRFRNTRGLASVRALQGDEFALLLSDLDYYHSLRRRYELGIGPKPPPPDKYLTPGREEWGCLADLVNELYPQVGAASGCRAPAVAECIDEPEEDLDEWLDNEDRWR